MSGVLFCCFSADVHVLYAAKLGIGWWERVEELDIKLQNLSLRLQEYRIRHYEWDMVKHSFLRLSGTL